MQTVCITALDDGTFSVELENEAAEGGMGEGQEPMEGTPADMQEDQTNGEQEQMFQSIDEALSAAKEMLMGGSEEQGENPMMDGEEEFTQGFKSVRGTPDEQMAARRR